jgi:hypothetical protein
MLKVLTEIPFLTLLSINRYDIAATPTDIFLQKAISVLHLLATSDLNLRKGTFDGESLGAASGPLFCNPRDWQYGRLCHNICHLPAN